MTDKLPQLKDREIIRALKRDGWKLDRTKGGINTLPTRASEVP